MAQAPPNARTTPDDLLPSRAARRNLAFAYQAIRRVRLVLPLRKLEQPTPTGLQPEQVRSAHVTREDFGRWLIGRHEQVWAIEHEWAVVQHGGDDWTTSALIHRLARAAERSASGDAGEQAAVAFAFLSSLGVRPLDFMHTPGRAHAFVVIGRAEPQPERPASEHDDQPDGMFEAPRAAVTELRPETWGKDAVVCDPYRGVAYRQPELMNTEYYYDYYPCESQLHVPVGQDQAVDG